MIGDRWRQENYQDDRDARCPVQREVWRTSLGTTSGRGGIAFPRSGPPGGAVGFGHAGPHVLDGCPERAADDEVVAGGPGELVEPLDQAGMIAIEVTGEDSRKRQTAARSSGHAEPVSKVDRRLVLMYQLVFTAAVPVEPHEVFRYLTEPDLLPRWIDGLRESRPLGDGVMRVGAKSIEVVQARGKTFEMISEVTALDGERALSVRITYPRRWRH
jgi:hypothetical protein